MAPIPEPNLDSDSRCHCHPGKSAIKQGNFDGTIESKSLGGRTEIYLEMIPQTDIMDPRNLMTPEGLRDAAIETKGQKIPLLPIDPNSEEWRGFEAKIEAFASSEVRFLYWLWDSAVAAWTWAISAAVSHYQLSDEERYQEWRERIRQTYNITFFARDELITQIRPESANSAVS